MKKNFTPLVGAHMSISKGFKHSFIDAHSIGCTALQIFLHSNRQWAMRDLSVEKIREFREGQHQTDIRHVVVHASYLLNLASSNKETRIKSLTTLTKELDQCNKLGISYLIMHPGSAGGRDRKECIAQIALGIDEALTAAPGPAMILLEHMGGAGGLIGAQFEELKQLRNSIKQKERIGFCFDTCHAWVAGYDFSHPHSYNEMWDTYDKILGLENLKAFHVNDSQKERGSRRDRHAHIGMGTLGLEPFALLMNDPRFISIPKILETPTGADPLLSFKNNVHVLLDLIN